MIPQILFQLCLCLAVTSVVNAVVGGQAAGPEDYPWSTILRKDGRLYCGGAIINAWTVLTVAQCVVEDPKQINVTYTVTAGDWNRKVDEGTEQERNISTIIAVVYQLVKHPRFDDECHEHDIAILILETPLVFNTWVQPVDDLSDRFFDDVAIASNHCAIAGWGASHMDSLLIATFPDKKHALLSTNVISTKDCKRALGSKFTATRNMICTDNTGAGPCYGDGGAPLVCPDSDGVVRLVGLPFWLTVYDCNYGLTVYTRISAHRKWIEENQAHG